MIEQNKGKCCQHKWLALLGISLIALTAFLDFTIVNTALPAVQRGLHASLLQLQWVMNIYFLILCGSMVVAGKLADLFGTRRLFYLGAATFAIASLIAGLSTTAPILVFARGLQGIGAAILFPVATSLLSQCTPPHERPHALSIFGSVGGIGLAAGPFLGGILISTLGWRWIFFINLPIIAIGSLLCLYSVRSGISQLNKVAIDWLGFALLLFSIIMLVIGIIHIEASGIDTSTPWIYIGIALISTVGLLIWENHQAEPILDFHLFRKPVFIAGALANGLGGAVSAIVLFFNPLYLHAIRHENAFITGCLLVAAPLAVMIFSPFTANIIKRIGVINTVIIGVLAAVTSSIMQATFKIDTSFVFIVIAYFIMGIPWCIGNTAAMIAAQQSVDESRLGVATGSVFTMFDILGSISLAIAVVVFRRFEAKISANTAHAFMHGFSAAMWVLFAISVLILGTLIIKKLKSQ